MANHLNENLKQRIEEQGLTEEGAAKKAGLDRGYFSKLFSGAISAPTTGTLAKIALALGTTPASLLAMTVVDEESTSQVVADARIDMSKKVPDTYDLPKNVEVRGTAAGSHARGAFQLTNDPIDYVRRPPALIGAKDVYALYVEGSSMEPQYFPGDLIYIHPNKPARPGDPVVIQTAVSEHEVEGTIGIYLRQTEKYVVIRKHNPIAEVQILRNQGTRVHKIMTLNELFGV